MNQKDIAGEAPWLSSIQSASASYAPYSATSAGDSWLVSLRNQFRPRASKNQLLFVFRQMALLVETGIDVAEAIEIMAENSNQKVLRETLEGILEQISNGSSLSAAVDAHRHALGDNVACSIQAGEASGRLVEVLKQMADQLEDQLQMRAAVAGALAYPAILSFAGFVITQVMIWFVLPQFERTFASMGTEPPVYTYWVLTGAGAVREYFPIIAFLTLASIATLCGLLMKKSVRSLIGNLCFRSPVIGGAISKIAVGQLFVDLGHLLSNGVSLLDGIQLLRRGVNNGAIRDLIENWEYCVSQGKGLSSDLDQFDFLPEGASSMLVTAEKTGRLESVLATAGEYYRSQGTAKLKQLLKLSEPTIILLLGILVGLVVASVLLPILDVQAAGT